MFGATGSGTKKARQPVNREELSERLVRGGAQILHNKPKKRITILDGEKKAREILETLILPDGYEIRYKQKGPTGVVR